MVVLESQFSKYFEWLQEKRGVTGENLITNIRIKT